MALSVGTNGLSVLLLRVASGLYFLMSHSGINSTIKPRQPSNARLPMTPRYKAVCSSGPAWAGGDVIEISIAIFFLGEASQ